MRVRLGGEVGVRVRAAGLHRAEQRPLVALVEDGSGLGLGRP